MQSTFPVQVTFHGVHKHEGLEDAARSHAEHLTRFHPRIHGCKVVIGRAEGSAHTARGRYHVQVRVEIPGNDVVVAHQPARPEHEDPLVAIGDAFRVAERRLEDVDAIRRGR